MNLTFSNTGKIDGFPTTHKLAFRNTGTTVVYWGFEPDTSAAGDKQGVPLKPGTDPDPGEGVILDGDDNITKPIYFACAGSGSVNYTRMT